MDSCHQHAALPQMRRVWHSTMASGGGRAPGGGGTASRSWRRWGRTWTAAQQGERLCDDRQTQYCNNVLCGHPATTCKNDKINNSVPPGIIVQLRPHALRGARPRQESPPAKQQELAAFRPPPRAPPLIGFCRQAGARSRQVLAAQPQARGWPRAPARVAHVVSLAAAQGAQPPAQQGASWQTACEYPSPPRVRRPWTQWSVAPPMPRCVVAV